MNVTLLAGRKKIILVHLV